MINCPNCGKEFDPVGKWKVRLFCSRSCANKRVHTDETKAKISNTSRGKHKVVSEETKQKIRKKLVGRDNYWNRGKKLSPERIEQMRTLASSRVVSATTKKKLSKAAKDRGLGGHTSKRKLYFKKNNGEVIYLQSGYEIRFAELLEKLNVVWSRPDPLIWVDVNGDDHKYYPDFKVGDVYLDTKNDYLATKDAEKVARVKEQNNIDLRVVLNHEITEEYIGSLVQW